MQVYTKEDAAQNLWEKGLLFHRTAVALGGFDAMHIGHQAIIQKVVEKAKEEDLTSVVYLFRNHPRAVVMGDAMPRVYSFEKRLSLLESMGVDAVVAEWFTPEYQQLTPQIFVKDYIKGRLDARYLAVGFNYRFGNKGEGDTQMLKQLCTPLGISVDALSAVELYGEAVSSSRVRELIQGGQVSVAAECLGRAFSVSGEVVSGNRLGRTMGFPTANLVLKKELLLPKFGVYITKTKTDGRWIPSITNVGERPTVTDQTPWLETHLLDFKGDLYGRNIEVAFYEPIREISEFSGLDELKNQLAMDKARAKQYFGQ